MPGRRQLMPGRRQLVHVLHVWWFFFAFVLLGWQTPTPTLARVLPLRAPPSQSELGQYRRAAADARMNSNAMKAIILHDAHEGSHGTCQAFAKLCVRTDCRETHDAVYHNWSIDFDGIDASNAEVFLTRFYSKNTNISAWRKYKVLVLVRQDLLAWSLGVYHTSNPAEIVAKPGQPLYINTTLLHKCIIAKIQAWKAKLATLQSLTTEVDDISVHVYFYEKFLEEGVAYLRRVADAAHLLDGKPNTNCSSTSIRGQGSHRSHGPGRCSTSFGDVSNCAEVVHFFEAGNFPTWHSLAHAAFGNLAVV